MIGRWLRRLLYWGAVTLVVAGLAHLGSILAIPFHSPDDAYADMLAATGGVPLQTVALVPPHGGPDQDPALVRAVCLFDLRQGPVAVSLNVARAAFAAVSVHTRFGRVISGLTNRSASQNQLALTLLTAEQATHRPAPAEGALPELRVESAELRGFVVAQWLATSPSERPLAEAGVTRLSCRPAG